MFLNIKFVEDNNLILKRPRGGLWTWSILLDAYDEVLDYGDGYVVLRAPMDGLR